MPEPWTPFAAEFSYDVFDADASANIQESSKVLGRWQIHAFGVGDADAERILNVNLGPTVSSLFQSGLEEDSEWFHELGRADYILSRVLQPVRTETITVRSVDSMVDEGLIPSPNWLRIDAQGAESEILRGAAEAIRNTCVACTIETNFTDMYTVGKTFGVVHDFLDRLGWFLASFEPICGSPFRYPFGVRGRSIPFAADSLYLRDPRSISGEDELKAAALISTCIGFTEFGVAALTRLALLWPGSLLGNHASEVDKFLSEMAGKLQGTLALPPCWDEVANTELNSQRSTRPPTRANLTKDYDLMLTQSSEFEAFLRSWNLIASANSVAGRREQFLSHRPVQEWEHLQRQQTG